MSKHGTDYKGDDFYCDMVLSGKVEVEKIEETENILAFKHTKPSFPTHIVVIPKQHIPSLAQLTDTALMVEMLEAVRDIAADVLADTGAARVVTNMGEYQDSKHLHFHITSDATNR